MKITPLKPFKIEARDGSLQLMGTGREPGLHLSSIIKEKKRAAGESVSGIDGEQDNLRSTLGFLWERVLDLVWLGVGYRDALEIAWKEYLEMAHLEIPGRTEDREVQLRLEANQIKMTPDAFDRGAWRLESYKLTWRSMRAWEQELEAKFWSWLDAEAAYLLALSEREGKPVLKVLFVVFWINGDYSREKWVPGARYRGPQATWTEVEFTQEELEYRWRTIIRYRDWMVKQGAAK